MNVEIKIGENQIIKMSLHDLGLLSRALARHVEWREGGMFGDGDKITDKRGYNQGKKLLEKLIYKL